MALRDIACLPCYVQFRRPAAELGNAAEVALLLPLLRWWNPAAERASLFSWSVPGVRVSPTCLEAVLSCFFPTMSVSEYEAVVDALVCLVPDFQPDGRILLRLAGTNIHFTEEMIRPLQEFLVREMCKTLDAERDLHGDASL